VQARPLFDFLNRVSADIHRPAAYIERVLTEPALPGPTTSTSASPAREAP